MPLSGGFAEMGLVYEHRAVDRVLRLLDVVIAGATLLVLSPILALVAIAILVSSGPPVLYGGPRVGRGGVVFTMFKFRTLRRGAETRLDPYYGPELTRRTALEVTTVGRALRATHLDEVPQLINVLRGEMSIVGPRPIRPSFYEELLERIPQYWQRLVVPPGVTGFAQTRMGREDAWAAKLVHDLEYIADRSIVLYVRVLLATALRVMRRTFGGE